MSGSYLHIVTEDDGALLEPREILDQLDSDGDVIECITELYGMLWWLAEENVDDRITKDRWARRAEYISLARAKAKEGLELSPTERYQPLDYEAIAREATQSDAYRQGLIDAAKVARAQDGDPQKAPCPASMVAVYLERLANGENP